MKRNIYFILKSIIDFIMVFITITKSKTGKNTSIKLSFEKSKNIKCLILGNGPSLNEDVEFINEDGSDIYVVNYFARSKYFSQLKPTKYFFSDKMFWSENILDRVERDNKIIFEILQSVSWKMDIFCPAEGYIFFKNILSKNKNLTLKVVPIRYSNLLLEKSSYNAIKNKYYSVPNVNSVITLLWMTIFMGYEKIMLYGCDFSAFQNLSVDQKTNEVIVSTEHFYGNSVAEKDASKKYINHINKPLSMRFYQIHRSFKLLDLLASISKELGVQVINKSSFSFIDSFPRSESK